MSIKSFGVLCVMVLTSLAVPVHAESSKAEIAQVERSHELMVKHTLFGTREVFAKVGPQLKIMASLQACELESLASTLEPSNAELEQAALKYVTATPEARELGVELIASIKASALYYRVGYREAVTTMLHVMPKVEQQRLCTEVTRVANDALAKKEAAATAKAN